MGTEPTSRIDRIFDIFRGEVSFEYISIKNGLVKGNPGGCLRIHSGANVNLTGVNVSECEADSGGGIENRGELHIENSVITQNIVANHIRRENDSEPLSDVVEENFRFWYQSEPNTLGTYYLRGGGIANIGGNIEISSSMLTGIAPRELVEPSVTTKMAVSAS